MSQSPPKRNSKVDRDFNETDLFSSDAEIVKKCLDQCNTDKKQLIGIFSDDGYTPIAHAVLNGNVAALKVMEKNPSIFDIEEESKNKRSICEWWGDDKPKDALHLAVAQCLQGIPPVHAFEAFQVITAMFCFSFDRHSLVVMQARHEALKELIRSAQEEPAKKELAASCGHDEDEELDAVINSRHSPFLTFMVSTEGLMGSKVKMHRLNEILRDDYKGDPLGRSRDILKHLQEQKMLTKEQERLMRAARTQIKNHKRC